MINVLLTNFSYYFLREVHVGWLKQSLTKTFSFGLTSKSFYRIQKVSVLIATTQAAWVLWKQICNISMKTDNIAAFTTTAIARLKSNAKEISVYLLSSKVDDFARK